MGLCSCPLRMVPQPVILPQPLPSLRCTVSPRFAIIKCTLTSNHTDQIVKEDAKENVELLACPICFQPLLRKGPRGMIQSAISRSSFKCNNCKKAFSSRDVFLDLTITAGLTKYQEILPNGTDLFRNPVVSFVYERGWRQSFARRGFPGPDEELKLAQNFLEPTRGGILLDVSCGSGLFSRRFAKVDAYSAVIALDFSENMLRQAHELIKKDQTLDNRNLALVRADVARLPFATGTIDAVHAGAAIHCWPSPTAAVAEISRILRPGGVFVATTFLSPFGYFPISELEPLQKILQQTYGRVLAGSSVRYWLEAELRDICLACGFIDFRSVKRQGFIMLCVTKPAVSEEV